MKQLLITVATLIACQSPKNPNPPLQTTTSAKTDSIKTGGNKLITIDGKYKVWTSKLERTQ